LVQEVLLEQADLVAQLKRVTAATQYSLQLLQQAAVGVRELGIYRQPRLDQVDLVEVAVRLVQA
jgi:hypothetical protein